MTSSLSFRKESIQRSSSASETLKHAQQAQGPRPAREPWSLSLTTFLTSQG